MTKMEKMEWLNELSQELGKQEAFVEEVESTVVRHQIDLPLVPLLNYSKSEDELKEASEPWDGVVFLEYLREFSRKHQRVVFAAVVPDHVYANRKWPGPIEIIYYYCPHYDSQHELLEALKNL